MKKIFKLLFLIVTISTIFLACGENNTNEKNEVTLRSSPLKQISNWFYLGDIHNEYMMEACSSFDAKGINTKEEGLIYISDFATDFTPSDDRHHEDISEGISNFTNDWTFLIENQLKAEANSDRIHESLASGVTLGLIDNFEKNLLIEILNLTNENYSFEELNDFIDEKILSWEAQGYAESDHFGTYSGMVLAISKKSTEWWLTHEECLLDESSRWVWLASDAVGAGIGLCVALISHELTGESNPDSVGVSIVAGAVVGSLGIAGRLGKAISKWWP
ncbi:MAG: hypothetical protein AAGA77_09950 [Bacteroidota bacterium]